ncbi:MAG: CoA transferase [Chloroflexota bacterium]
MSNGALAGLKVVEWGNFISAAYCTKLMADFGADVIKIEEPLVGDEARHHGPFLHDFPHPERSGLFLFLNTNKLGITLNVKSATGKEIFKRLIKDADILVENNPPKLVKGLGLDYGTVSKINPRLVVASITPYGQTGPYKDYKAYDLNSSAAGGLSCGIGYSGSSPLVLPLSQCHYQGALGGACASLLAIVARDVTGKGQHADVSEAEVCATLQVGTYMPQYIFYGVVGMRTGHRGGLGRYPTGILPCEDGYVCITAPRVDQWIRFTELMGSPEWAKNPRYRDRRAMQEEYPDEADALLAPWLTSHTKADIFESGQGHRVPLAPVNTVAEVVNDSHLRTRGFFVEFERAEVGKLKYPGAPYKMSKTPWRIERPAPLIGEHNEEVYCNRLGYSREELAWLRRGGIV